MLRLEDPDLLLDSQEGTHHSKHVCSCQCIRMLSSCSTLTIAIIMANMFAHVEACGSDLLFNSQECKHVCAHQSLRA